MRRSTCWSLRRSWPWLATSTCRRTTPRCHQRLATRSVSRSSRSGTTSTPLSSGCVPCWPAEAAVASAQHLGHRNPRGGRAALGEPVERSEVPGGGEAGHEEAGKRRLEPRREVREPVADRDMLEDTGEVRHGPEVGAISRRRDDVVDLEQVTVGQGEAYDAGGGGVDRG